MKEIIPIACDHAGFELKEVVKKHLEERGFEVKDFGTNSAESVDYPDFAHLATQQRVATIPTLPIR